MLIIDISNYSPILLRAMTDCVDRQWTFRVSTGLDFKVVKSNLFFSLT